MASQQVYRWVRTVARFLSTDPWNNVADTEFSLEGYRQAPRNAPAPIEEVPNVFGIRSEIDGVVRCVHQSFMTDWISKRVTARELPALVAQRRPSRTIGGGPGSHHAGTDPGEVLFNIGPGVSARAPARVLQALLATINYRLEPEGVGIRFPMTAALRRGWVDVKDAEELASELRNIADELITVPVRSVVWDLANLRLRDDADQPVNHHALNAHDYFITSDGEPLVTVLATAANWCATQAHPLVTASISKLADRRRRVGA